MHFCHFVVGFCKTETLGVEALVFFSIALVDFCICFRKCKCSSNFAVLLLIGHRILCCTRELCSGSSSAKMM